MATYVLVGGAWLGGWCWQPVARRLREGGHEAYPVTLTGLGERSHLASPEVDLDTHIADVVNLIEFEDLHEVVLLGHSYAADLIIKYPAYSGSFSEEEATSLLTLPAC